MEGSGVSFFAFGHKVCAACEKGFFRTVYQSEEQSALDSGPFNKAELEAVGADELTPSELKANRVSPYVLRVKGFSASELKHGGFTARELLHVFAGFSVEELKTAGFTESPLRDAGQICESDGPSGTRTCTGRATQRSVTLLLPAAWVAILRDVCA